MSGIKINKHINTIIWDWNGTLLNDVDICVKSMNQMLSRRQMKLISRSLYKDIFTFPVKVYYEKIGWDFNKEPFDEIGIEFMDLYFKNLEQSFLHQHTIEILNYLKQKNYIQTVLSAMEHRSLENSLSKKGIRDFFTHVAGISNHYADGKLETARKLIERIKISPERICLFGDTLHDLEVANQIGCNCVLIADGHQSYERLENAGVPVFGSLIELKGIC